MCPFCNDPNTPCRVLEQPDGKLVCECGRHAWPNAATYEESVRLANLTVTRMVQSWTQGY